MDSLFQAACLWSCSQESEESVLEQIFGDKACKLSDPLRLSPLLPHNDYHSKEIHLQWYSYMFPLGWKCCCIRAAGGGRPNHVGWLGRWRYDQERHFPYTQVF